MEKHCSSKTASQCKIWNIPKSTTKCQQIGHTLRHPKVKELLMNWAIQSNNKHFFCCLPLPAVADLCWHREICQANQSHYVNSDETTQSSKLCQDWWEQAPPASAIRKRHFICIKDNVLCYVILLWVILDSSSYHLFTVKIIQAIKHYFKRDPSKPIRYRNQSFFWSLSTD